MLESNGRTICLACKKVEKAIIGQSHASDMPSLDTDTVSRRREMSGRDVVKIAEKHKCPGDSIETRKLTYKYE